MPFVVASFIQPEFTEVFPKRRTRPRLPKARKGSKGGGRRTACALEQYKLANGRYPDNLAQLVSAFLPKTLDDVIDGKPLRYRLDGGRFVLYSIGWNTKDDGGEYPPKTERKIDVMRSGARVGAEPGDWVWRYP